jgi:hypothetical protein
MYRGTRSATSTHTAFRPLTTHVRPLKRPHLDGIAKVWFPNDA